MTLAGRTPTAAEQLWLDRIVQLGCIICLLFRNGQYTPPEVHHLDGKTKPEAHLKALPLCCRHHRHTGEHWTSRAEGKKAFEAAYMPEEDLLFVCRGLVEDYIQRGWIT